MWRILLLKIEKKKKYPARCDLSGHWIEILIDCSHIINEQQHPSPQLQNVKQALSEKCFCRWKLQTARIETIYHVITRPFAHTIKMWLKATGRQEYFSSHVQCTSIMCASRLCKLRKHFHNTIIVMCVSINMCVCVSVCGCSLFISTTTLYTRRRRPHVLLYGYE